MNKSIIKEIKQVSRTIQVDNSLDAEREVAVAANVQFVGETVSSITNGVVSTLDGKPLAEFGEWQNGRTNVTFVNGSGTPRATVLSYIDAFCEDINSPE